MPRVRAQDRKTVWELAYKDVLDLGLTDRMVNEGKQNV